MGLAGLLRPRCLRPRHQRCRDVADQAGVRAGGGKGEPHTRRHLDNAGTDAAAPIRIGGNDVSTGFQRQAGDAEDAGLVIDHEYFGRSLVIRLSSR